MDIDIAAEPGNALGNTPSTVTTTAPANGATTVAGNTITYTPGPGYLSADSFDYTITDTDGETEDSSVLVTGTASDGSQITRVTVAGTGATTTNGFANWRAVELNGPTLSTPRGVALDAANGRALLVDSRHRRSDFLPSYADP